MTKLNNSMGRIEREKQTVRKMIELYCRHHLKQGTMPDEYNKDYIFQISVYYTTIFIYCKFAFTI